MNLAQENNITFRYAWNLFLVVENLRCFKFSATGKVQGVSLLNKAYFSTLIYFVILIGVCTYHVPFRCLCIFPFKLNMQFFVR